eukprot:1687931-Amphidinium_carterae.1
MALVQKKGTEAVLPYEANGLSQEAPCSPPSADNVNPILTSATRPPYHAVCHGSLKHFCT